MKNQGSRGISVPHRQQIGYSKELSPAGKSALTTLIQAGAKAIPATQLEGLEQRLLTGRLRENDRALVRVLESVACDQAQTNQPGFREARQALTKMLNTWQTK